MFLPIQIARINSPYNVNLLLTYTGCLSQREHCIEVSLYINESWRMAVTQFIKENWRAQRVSFHATRNIQQPRK